MGASGDYYLGARIATAGSLLSVVLTLFMSSNIANHDTSHHENIRDNCDMDENRHIDSGDELSPEGLGQVGKIKEGNDNSSNRASENRIKANNSLTFDNMLKSLMKQVTSIAGVVKIVWLLLSVKIISSVANSMLSETFPLVLKNVFHLSEQSLGLAIASNSAFNGIVNGLFLAPLVAHSGGDLIKVITLCLVLMTSLALTLSAVSLPSFSILFQFLSAPSSGAASELSNSGSNSLYAYLGLTFTLSIFQYALSTTITGESTSLVKKAQKGTLLGVEHSFFALARIVAPQVGVMLLKSGGVSAVSSVSGVIYFTVSLLWGTYKQTLKSIKSVTGALEYTGDISGKGRENMESQEGTFHSHTSSSSGKEELIFQRKGK